MTDNDPFGPALGGRGKRPWFGRRRFGYGYGPQTWQGFFVTAILVALVITAGAVAKNTPWFYAAVGAAIVVPLAIISAQRR